VAAAAQRLEKRKRQAEEAAATAERARKRSSHAGSASPEKH